MRRKGSSVDDVEADEDDISSSICPLLPSLLLTLRDIVSLVDTFCSSGNRRTVTPVLAT